MPYVHASMRMHARPRPVIMHSIICHGAPSWLRLALCTHSPLLSVSRSRSLRVSPRVNQTLVAELWKKARSIPDSEKHDTSPICPYCFSGTELGGRGWREAHRHRRHGRHPRPRAEGRPRPAQVHLRRSFLRGVPQAEAGRGEITTLSGQSSDNVVGAAAACMLHTLYCATCGKRELGLRRLTLTDVFSHHNLGCGAL